MNKDNLNKAFKEMRRSGLIAKQNFSCCGSCAGYEIASDLSDKITKNPSLKNKVKGCVFYHQQSAKTLRDYGYTYLNFGSVNLKEFGEIGDTLAVGKLVVEILTKHGIPVKWNGTISDSIMIGEDRRAKRVAA